MRLLSPNLLAAQKAASGEPYVQVIVEEKLGETTRLSFTRLYTGTESDFYHAATVPGDGSLIRARVDPGANTLYVQRVASPVPGSAFSNWTSFGGPISGAAGIALASSGAQVLLFYVAADNVTIYLRESSNNGISFGDGQSVVLAPSDVKWMAAAVNSSGVVALFYALATGVVYVIKRTAGTWGSPSAWTNSVSQVTGLACVYQSDFNLAVAGTDSSSHYKLWTTVYGDGVFQALGTWSALAEVAKASSGSGVEYHAPFLGYQEVFRLFVVEKFTGTVSYSRPFWTHSLPTLDFLQNRWRDLLPFDLSSTYGMALSSDGSYVYLTTPSGVWRASRAISQIDLSQDLLSLELHLEPSGGQAEIILRNDDGRYNTPGSGIYAAIKKGSQVRIGLGYRTASGLETSPLSYLWIDSWIHRTGNAGASFHIRARDGWGLLNSWRSRRQYSWAAGERNVSQLLAFVLSKVGLPLSSLSYSSTLVNHYPAFTIHPDERGSDAARRLLGMVQDVLFFRSESGLTKYIQPTEASDYTYGTDHVILEGEYESAAQPANRVQVFGTPGMAESFTWSEVEPFERLSQVRDLNLDTTAKMQDRSAAELFKAATHALEGVIRVPVNCGQELFDVVAIADPQAGLSSAKRRVLGLATRFDASKGVPIYFQKLLLGGIG